MGFKENLKIRRKELNLTLEDLAQAANISKATVQRYEKGDIVNVPTDKIEKLAEKLQCSPSFLMGWSEDLNHNIKYYPNLFKIKTQKIPLLGNIAAGIPIFANEEHESYVEVGSNIKADFCLKIKGDSMINARIYDGDIVFIKQQNDVEDGEIAAVIIDDEATLKRVYKFPGRIQLRSENPKYKPMDFYEKDNVRIIGKAIAFQSDIY